MHNMRMKQQNGEHARSALPSISESVSADRSNDRTHTSMHMPHLSQVPDDDPHYNVPRQNPTSRTTIMKSAPPIFYSIVIPSHLEGDLRASSQPAKSGYLPATLTVWKMLSRRAKSVIGWVWGERGVCRCRALSFSDRGSEVARRGERGRKDSVGV